MIYLYASGVCLLFHYFPTRRSSETLGPVSRGAVNLRGVDADDLGRGDALLTPGAWELTSTVDVRRMSGAGFDESPPELIVHVGTAAVTARVRPLGGHHARLILARPRSEERRVGRES